MPDLKRLRNKDRKLYCRLKVALTRARRLGVSPNTLEEAYQKGEAYFQDWCKRRDPSKKAWQKRDDFFHPLSD